KRPRRDNYRPFSSDTGACRLRKRIAIRSKEQTVWPHRSAYREGPSADRSYHRKTSNAADAGRERSDRRDISARLALSQIRPSPFACFPQYEPFLTQPLFYRKILASS